MGASPEPKKHVDAGAPRWMVTFGDLMSLLLCFFVLLLSFSEMDRQKYKQVAGSMEKAFGVQRRTKVMDIPKGMKMIAKDFDQELIATRIRDDIGKELNDIISSQLTDLKDQIEIDSDDERMTIRLMGESTFDSGKAVIRPQMKPLLQKVAELIRGNAHDIIVAGHTDNVPIHSGPYRTNLRLSTARASAVAEYIITHSKINPQRISTMGFGEYRPIDTNETPEGRQKNRRVEIILSNLPSLGKVREYN